MDNCRKKWGVLIDWFKDPQKYAGKVLKSEICRNVLTFFSTPDVSNRLTMAAYFADLKKCESTFPGIIDPGTTRLWYRGVSRPIEWMDSQTWKLNSTGKLLVADGLYTSDHPIQSWSSSLLVAEVFSPIVMMHKTIGVIVEATIPRSQLIFNPKVTNALKLVYSIKNEFETVRFVNAPLRCKFSVRVSHVVEFRKRGLLGAEFVERMRDLGVSMDPPFPSLPVTD